MGSWFLRRGTAGEMLGICCEDLLLRFARRPIYWPSVKRLSGSSLHDQETVRRTLSCKKLIARILSAKQNQ